MVPQKNGILSETSSVATIMYCIGAWVSEVARLRIFRKTKISRHIFQPGVKTRVHQNPINHHHYLLLTPRNCGTYPHDCWLQYPFYRIPFRLFRVKQGLTHMCPFQLPPCSSLNYFLMVTVIYHLYIYIHTLIFKGCFMMLDDMHHIIICHS